MLLEERHKNETKYVNENSSLLFNFCNIFDLLNSTTEEIVWWDPIFKPDFYIFSYYEHLRIIYRNSIDQFLLYHTSLRELLTPLEHIICFTFIPAIAVGHICSDHDRKLISLPARFGGFGIPIKTKRETRYRNTLTQLPSRTNDNEKHLNIITQEKRVSN